MRVRRKILALAVRIAQEQLYRRHIYSGKLDGVLGVKTKRAVRVKILRRINIPYTNDYVEDILTENY